MGLLLNLDIKEKDMSEKSGIEMLEEIISRLLRLEQKIDILDKNVKRLMNTEMPVVKNTRAGVSSGPMIKAGVQDIEKKINDIKAKTADAVAKSGFKNFGFESSTAQNSPAFNKGNRLAVPNIPSPSGQNVMVKGRLKLDKGENTIPLSGASVKIFDEKDVLVKSTKTNRAGHWMSQLPPGKYVALFEGEIDGKKLQSQNKLFEVPQQLPEGRTEFEVI